MGPALRIMAVNVQVGLEILSSRDTGLTCDPLQNTNSLYGFCCPPDTGLQLPREEESMAHFFLKDTDTNRAHTVEPRCFVFCSTQHCTVSYLYTSHTSRPAGQRQRVCVCVCVCVSACVSVSIGSLALPHYIG